MQMVSRHGTSGLRLLTSIFDQPFCLQSRSFCIQNHKFCIRSNSFCIGCRKIVSAQGIPIKDGRGDGGP